MARQQSSASPARKRAGSAADSSLTQLQGEITATAQINHTHVFQGPVAHPEILRGYDEIVPGTAQRMIQLAEDESLHRRGLENESSRANIFAQKKQLEIAEQQSVSAFESDRTGQYLGALVSLSCIGGAVFLALDGREIAAAALSALPTAAVIQAFFAKKQTK